MEFYNENLAKAKNIDIIYCNRDRSEDAMVDFMVEFKMNWPALDFDDKDDVEEIISLYGNAVPSYVLVDAEGKKIAEGAQAKAKAKELAEM